jgi:nitrogen-specific signal transduction histidine kinase
MDSKVALAFAIAHEVGNHLGGIRLQAHLLDDELDSRALASASVLIDDLAGRAGPLLALLRPLLSEAGRGAGGARWGDILSRVRRQIEDEGTRGVRLEIEGDLDTDRDVPELDWLHSLLVALIGATLERMSREGHLKVQLMISPRETVLVLVDDGTEEDFGEEAAPRGRPLVVSIARELLFPTGGQVETSRDGALTQVRLTWPAFG